jgi:hypothetical protein
MTLISHGYGTAINSLFTDKPHSMESPTWTLEMVTKYFAMKHESKPRDYKLNRQDSSSNRQDSSSKKQEATSNTEANSHDRQQKRQKKCRYCNKRHSGSCPTIMNNLNPSKSLPSDNTKSPTTSTATIELAADSTINKSYFAKAIAETSQHNWHIDSDATYTITPDKAWFVTYEPKENEHIKIGNKKLQKVKGIGIIKLPNGLKIQNVRHTLFIKVNLIALADLRHYKPRYLWETAEFLLHIDDTTTIRVPISDRL